MECFTQYDCDLDHDRLVEQDVVLHAGTEEGGTGSGQGPPQMTQKKIKIKTIFMVKFFFFLLMGPCPLNIFSHGPLPILKAGSVFGCMSSV